MSATIAADDPMTAVRYLWMNLRMLSQELLGRCIFRGQRRILEPRRRRAFSGIGFRVQQLGDSKVEQLGDTFPGDEDIRGLDISMDDEIAVRMRQCGKHVQ